MTIFEELRTDHDEQRRLVALLVETHGDSDGRDELFEQLQEALEAHAKAEERHFYRPLLEFDMTQEKARHSIHEHEQLDDLVEQLEGYDRTAPAWKQTAEQLAEKLEHHLSEEEQEVFPLAGRVLDDASWDEHAGEYRAHMEELTSSGASS